MAARSASAGGSARSISECPALALPTEYSLLFYTLGSKIYGIVTEARQFLKSFEQAIASLGIERNDAATLPIPRKKDPATSRLYSGGLDDYCAKF
jgi:hypothetical protein